LRDRKGLAEATSQSEEERCARKQNRRNKLKNKLGQVATRTPKNKEEQQEANTIGQK
jgi:hypothetical protein